MAYTPQAIQFSETPSRMLFSLAEQSRQEQLMRQKAMLDDEKIRAALPMEFVDKVKNAEADVKTLYGKAYLNDLYTKIKNKVPTGEVQALAAQYAMDINDKSTAVANFKKQADDAINALGSNFGIDKARLKAQYGAYIYNNLLDPSKLGNGAEYIGTAIDTHPELFVDYRNGQEIFNKVIKDAPTVDLTSVVSKDITGTKTLKEVSGGKIPFYMQMVEGKGATGLPVMTPKLKIDKDGTIDKDVFDWFYNYGEGEKDYRMKTWIDAGANKMILEHNSTLSPDSPDYIEPANAGAKEIYKRKYLTSMLDQMKRYEAPRTSTVDVAKPTAEGGAKKEKEEVISLDAVQAIQDKVAKDEKANTKYTQINTLPGVGRDAVLKIARGSLGDNTVGIGDLYIKKVDGQIGIYAAKDITSPSDPSVVKINKGDFVSYIDTQANIIANQPLGQKAKAKAAAGKKVWNPQTGKFE